MKQNRTISAGLDISGYPVQGAHTVASSLQLPFLEMTVYQYPRKKLPSRLT